MPAHQTQGWASYQRAAQQSPVAPAPNPVDPNGPQSNIKRLSESVAKVPQSTPNLIALGLPPQNSEKTPMSMGDNGGNPINPVSTGYDCVYSDSAKTYCQLA
jgi:hypothetical protein